MLCMCGGQVIASRCQSLPFHLVSKSPLSAAVHPRLLAQGVFKNCPISVSCFVIEVLGFPMSTKGPAFDGFWALKLRTPHFHSYLFRAHSEFISPAFPLGFHGKAWHDSFKSFFFFTMFHPLKVPRWMTVPCLWGNYGLVKDQQIWESIL